MYEALSFWYEALSYYSKCSGAGACALPLPTIIYRRLQAALRRAAAAAETAAEIAAETADPQRLKRALIELI